jgi:hypothetical protein
MSDSKKHKKHNHECDVHCECHSIKHHHPQVHKDPSDKEIDPRYGVEKRRVPTGPNPLHH